MLAKKPLAKPPEGAFPKEKIIGVYSYQLGQVEIVARAGIEAEFQFISRAGSCPRITVGFDATWSRVVGYLFHEVFEFLMATALFRYECSEDLGKDQGGYLFLMNHGQFSDICTKAAMILSQALPDAAREHEDWRKKGVMKPAIKKNRGKT